MEEAESFGEQLQRYRKAADLSRLELAQRAGISRNSILNLERGATRGAHQYTVERLAQALELSGDDRGRFMAAVDRRRTPRTVKAHPPGPLVPWSLTLLIGREADLDMLRTQLMAPETRLVTVLGPAGVGKTRLAIAAAQEARPHFAHGAAFLSLAPLPDSDLFLSSIAHAFSIREGSGQPLWDAVVVALHERHLLLLLDNCEHLLPSLSLRIAALLEACPRITVLATSRSPLHLRGEQEMVIHPLPVPLPGQALTVEALGRVPAVTLFVQRARSVRPEFQITEATASAVATICRRLDGLPLAIELAAARIKLLVPDDLLARLDRRLPLLTGGPHDLPQRQQTLRDALAWSYDLLSEEEQSFFARLGVCVGGWTLATAEALSAAVDAERQAGSSLDALTALVQQSLVRVEDDRQGGPRFSLLETMRDFALECLAARGDEEGARRAHAHVFLALAEEAEPLLRGGVQQTEWFDRLEAEHGNLRAALQWTTLQGEEEIGLRLAGALGRFWDLHDHWAEGRQWIETLLALPLAAAAASEKGAARIRALRVAGALAYRQLDLTAASGYLKQSLTLARAAADRSGEAAALTVLATVRVRAGDTAAATTLLHESLALHRTLDDRGGIARVLMNLAGLAYDRGDYPAALASGREALVLQRAAGDLQDAGVTLNNMAAAAQCQGDADRAWDFFMESLVLHRQMGNRSGEALVLSNLAHVALGRDETAHAGGLFEDAVALYDALATPYHRAAGLLCQGHAAQCRGDTRTAERAFVAGQAAWQDLGQPWGVATALQSRAAVALGSGQADRAESPYRKALLLWKAQTSSIGMTECLEGLARCARVQGQLEYAARLLGAAAAQRAHIHILPPPADRQILERETDMVRAALGHAAYTVAWAEGQALTLEEAISLACAPLPQ